MPAARSDSRAYRRFQWSVWLTFAVVWAALAVAPFDRATWALENALVVMFAIVAWFVRDRFAPSRVATILLFVFLCLHEVGAHYTYSKVPYDRWCELVSGHTLSDLLGMERNHYDRFVHFAAGALVAPLLRELLLAWSALRDLGARLGSLAAVMSASLVYELIEWFAASVFGEGTGAAYLGTQGDTWDAQKDMALASLGALLALLFVRRKRAPTRLPDGVFEDANARR